jgi:hypothetical protein
MGRKHKLTLSRAANLRKGLESVKRRRVEHLNGDDDSDNNLELSEAHFYASNMLFYIQFKYVTSFACFFIDSNNC